MTSPTPSSPSRSTPLGPLGRVLSIAGSDSGGGAGIQADLKTISALGGYGLTAITALTAQDTRGVRDVVPVATDFILLQAEMALEDPGVDAIKLGMLPNAEVMRAIDRFLSRATVPVVADPVMVATSGDALAEESAPAVWREGLIRRATVLTPNIPEAEALLGRRIEDVSALEAAALDLLALGPKAVLLKGGHLAGDVLVDILANADGVTRFEDARIRTANTHGTGCTLASALATELAFGTPVVEAVTRARCFVREAIAAATIKGLGHGPLNHQYRVTRRD